MQIGKVHYWCGRPWRFQRLELLPHVLARTAPHAASKSWQLRIALNSTIVVAMASIANSSSNHDAPANGHGLPHRSNTIDVVEHRIDSGFKSIKGFARRKGRSTHTSLQDWELPDSPYHRYVHDLVAAGWTNLRDLGDYLGRETAQQGLIVSVLDIGDDAPTKRWPDILNEVDLKNFMDLHKRDETNVRLYLAEYQGQPSAVLIETLGSALKLDPRFFQWSIHSKGHVFTPSQRHRAPYVSLGFGVLDSSTSRKTDAEKFKVLVYIQVGVQTSQKIQVADVYVAR